MSTEEKRPRGRPPLPPEEAKEDVAKFRCTKAQKAMMRRAADDEGMSLSEWLLQTALKRASQ